MECATLCPIWKNSFSREGRWGRTHHYQTSIFLQSGLFSLDLYTRIQDTWQIMTSKPCRMQAFGNIFHDWERAGHEPFIARNKCSCVAHARTRHRHGYGTLKLWFLQLYRWFAPCNTLNETVFYQHQIFISLCSQSFSSGWTSLTVRAVKSWPSFKATLRHHRMRSTGEQGLLRTTAVQTVSSSSGFQDTTIQRNYLVNKYALIIVMLNVALQEIWAHSSIIQNILVRDRGK